MNRCTMLRVFACVPLALACGGAMALGLPKDPCALIKPADLQEIAPPNAKIAKGAVASDVPLSITCTYKWGPRTSEWGEAYVSIKIVDPAKVWPGVDAKRRVLAEATTGGADAEQIPGVADGAVFTMDPRSHNAVAKAYLGKAKPLIVEVTYHGGDGLGNKNRLITLLKTAAAAL